MEKRLKELRAETDELREKIKVNRAEEVDIMIEIYKDKHKLAEGDKVQVDTTKTGIITSFKPDWGGIKPQVQLYKKDGTLGKRTESVWGHQKITKLS